MSLSDWIEQYAKSTPEKSAIIFNGEAISYASLATQINNDVQILGSELGVKPGDRIAFLGFNSPKMISLIFACARIGAILLPLNWRLAGPEHCQLLNHSKPVALFVEDEFIEHANDCGDKLPSLKMINFNRPINGWISTQQLLNDNLGKPSYRSSELLSEEDGLLLCYTSGTTGVPKGALLSKKALAWNAMNSVDMHDLSHQDTVLTLLPMFHVGGLNIQTMPALSVGATVILLDKFEVDSFYQAFIEHPITTTLVVPTVMYAIMDDPRWQSLEADTLKMISIGSSVVPESLVSTICEWGVPLVQVYGSTETCPIAAYTPVTDAARKPASTGKTAKYCEIRLADENAKEVAEGEKGEILVRGPNVLLGYWQDEKSTRDSFTKEWFHTGDVGHFDEEGFLFVDGRIKEMIISGGENLYPAAIENTLSLCPEIEEVAVTGLPDDYWGEICVAVVVKRPGTNINTETIQKFCSDKIARSSIPRKIFVVDGLPRNAMGKVVKEALLDLIMK